VVVLEQVCAGCRGYALFKYGSVAVWAVCSGDMANHAVRAVCRSPMSAKQSPQSHCSHCSLIAASGDKAFRGCTDT